MYVGELQGIALALQNVRMKREIGLKMAEHEKNVQISNLVKIKI